MQPSWRLILMLMKELNNISRAQATYRLERMSGSVAEDISPSNYALVFTVCRAPGRSQETISQDLCLNKSTVARALLRLEEQGYVTRRPDPQDRRNLLIYPTEKLLPVLPEMRKINKEWNELILEGISDEQTKVFYEVLLKIEKNAREVLDGGKKK